MASMNELKVLGKAVMAGAVDAEMLGLDTVTQYLSMAFDEIARLAAVKRTEVPSLESRVLLARKGDEAGDG